MGVIYMQTIMETMFLPGYHHNGFVVTHAHGYMNRTLYAQVHELPQSRCGDKREGTFIYLFFLIIVIYR